MSDSLQDSLGSIQPIASTSTSIGQFEERGQSPSQEEKPLDQLDQQEPKKRPSKRKLSPSPQSPSVALPPSASNSTFEPVHDLPPVAPNEPEYPSIAPLPLFAAPPTTLPSHPSLEFHSTRSHPFNKHSFRYTPCGPSPKSPLPVPPQRQIEAEPRQVRWSWEDRSPFTYLTEDGKSVTTDKGWRGVRSNVGVREGGWYWEIKVERAGGEGGREDKKAGAGGDGQGSWVRVGVGRRESPLNAPVGVDGHSYGIRDKTGDSIHLAHPTPYGKPFTSHSTIGVYLSLPPTKPPPPTNQEGSSRDPRRIIRKRVPIRYKGQLYFEQLEYAPSKEMKELLVDPAAKKAKEEELESSKSKKKTAAPGTKVPPPKIDQGPPMRRLPKLEGSKIAFFVNGECQGVAFRDLFDFVPLEKHRGQNAKERAKSASRIVMENWHDDGSTGYYPFVSVFGGGICTINPGPHFDFPPPDNIDSLLEAQDTETTKKEEAREWRPLCERYEEFYAEQTRLDDLDEMEAIRLQVEARARELQRQQRAAERAAATGAAVGGGGGDGSIQKKPKLSKEPVASGMNLGVVGDGSVGKAIGIEESPGNSPAPFAIGESAVGGVKVEEGI